jgi:hypothetical protein
MLATCGSRRTTATPVMLLIAAAAFFPGAAAAAPASGTVNYKSKAGPIVITVANVFWSRVRTWLAARRFVN